MQIRIVAALTLATFAMASLGSGQSLAEVAKKEKERRKNNEKEAAVTATGTGTPAEPEEGKPKEEASKTASQPKGAEPEQNSGESESCRLAKDTVEGLKTDKARMEIRYSQVWRRAVSARVIDKSGRRPDRDSWSVSRAKGRKILDELTQVRHSLDETDKKIDTYTQKVIDACK